ncbi:MAG: zinc ribbon domain-containing protein [Clostridia bacterium]|nr:zinc ribbon domain-containing protein [Clostridia bacterium]
MTRKQNQENIWQIAAVVVLGAIAFVLVSNVLFPNRPGYNSGSLTAFITGILIFIVSILKILLVAGLVGGIILAIKKYLLDNEKPVLSFVSKDDVPDVLCPSCGALLNQESDVCPNCKMIWRCSCGKELQTGWKVCPNCGTNQDQIVEEKITNGG